MLYIAFVGHAHMFACIFTCVHTHMYALVKCNPIKHILHYIVITEFPMTISVYTLQKVEIRTYVQTMNS